LPPRRPIAGLGERWPSRLVATAAEETQFRILSQRLPFK
jgi:hypothetical protein